MSDSSPRLATDCIAFLGDELILIRRKYDPFVERLALPGGGVEQGETVEQACKREMKEETGLTIDRLELVGVYSDPDRDPRGHVVSVAFLAMVVGGEMKASSDAADIVAVDIDALDQHVLAFDHRDIIEDALEYIAGIVSKPAPGDA